MLAGRHDFIIEQGVKFDRTILWNDSNGSPMNLVGFSAAMKIKDKLGGSTIKSLTSGAGDIVLGGVNGTVEIVISATDTAAFTFNRAVYDLEMYPQGDTAKCIRLLEGNCILSREVTV